MTSRNKCRDCKWWQAGNGSNGFPEMGDCRVNPPALVQIGDLQRGLEFDTVWPRTEARDWCSVWTDRQAEWVPISQPTAAIIQGMCRAFEEAMSSPRPEKDEE